MIAALPPGGKRVETLLQGEGAGQPCQLCQTMLLKRSEVVPEILDVLVAQRARHAGHAARVVGPHATLEVPELPDDVFVVLPCDARDLVLAGEAAQAAQASAVLRPASMSWPLTTAGRAISAKKKAARRRPLPARAWISWLMSRQTRCCRA